MFFSLHQVHMEGWIPPGWWTNGSSNYDERNLKKCFVALSGNQITIAVLPHLKGFVWQIHHKTFPFLINNLAPAPHAQPTSNLSPPYWMCSGACMLHNLNTATTLTLPIIHCLNVAQVCNNASKKKKNLFNLEEIMCSPMCVQTRNMC